MSHVGKSYVGTCNNYTEEHINAVLSVPCQRIICGKEVGEKKGTPHLQLAIVFKSAKRMKAVQKLLGGGWHLEPMRGKWDDQEYCGKDGDIVRMEDNSKQGARTDIVEYSLAIQGKGRKRPMSDRELIDEYPVLVAKFPRFHTFVRKVMSREAAYSEYRAISVVAYVGPPGVGKTKATTMWNYEKQCVLSINTPKQWFDDYQGQENILMHEYTGQWPLEKFLTRTDGASPRFEEIKGGQIYLTNTSWTFTSNVHPKDWYPNASDYHKQAVMRRFAKIFVWDDKSSSFINQLK